MVLDGRRRLLALRRLRSEGRLAGDYPVDAYVETDPARHAAAVLLTNTALPVHVADVITTIGRMLRAKLTPRQVSAALGYAEVEVRRLAALAALPDAALEALRHGRLNTRQLRLLARLTDRKQQAEIAQAALDGFGFQEWRVAEQLDRGRVSERDPRFALVGAAAYAEAGGRTETDLFGERPAVLQDPAILQAVWADRAVGIAETLAADGRVVQVCGEAVAPDPALQPLGHPWGMGLDAAGLEAWRASTAAAQRARDGLEGVDLAAAEGRAAVSAFLAARLAADQAAEPGRRATLVQLTPDERTGLALTAWGPAAEGQDDEGGEPPGEADSAAAAGDACDPRFAAAAPTGAPIAAAPDAQLAGVGHALHAVRTDVATRALVRGLADDPEAALVALAARLFCVVVLRSGCSRGGGALAIDAVPYSRLGTAPIEALDGDVRRRLADRRAAWEMSGLSPIAWVARLDADSRLALLAELVGLSLDLREERTSALRRQARAEAAEIAALCGLDVGRRWTPDVGFLSAHPKGLLLAMLDDMGAPAAGLAALRKPELVEAVARAAAERCWAPAFLSWKRLGEPAAGPEGEDAAAAALSQAAR